MTAKATNIKQTGMPAITVCLYMEIWHHNLFCVHETSHPTYVDIYVLLAFLYYTKKTP